eukprot:354573-Alexandrium_andersonii.AAC.1
MEEAKARCNRVVERLSGSLNDWLARHPGSHRVCRALTRACDAWRDMGRATSRYVRLCRAGPGEKARVLGIVGRWEVE